MERLSFSILDTYSFVPRNQIEIHPAEMDTLQLVDYLDVEIESETGVKARCMIKGNAAVEMGNAKISKRCREALGVTGKTLMIHPSPYQFVVRGIPKVEDINKKTIVASQDLVEKYSNQIELMNVQNGFRMRCKIRKSDDNSFTNKIFLSRYHKLLLDIEENAETKLIITNVHRIQPAFVQKAWQNCGDFFKTIGTFLGKVFIGYRELDLRIGHIYPFDENHSVIRIHPNVRKVLGVEECDKLFISYNGKTAKLPVLDIDTDNINEVVKIENEFIDSHLTIGVSASTRNKLGIPNIGTVIKVRRSTKFLLLKHINKLILPLIALWFTIIQFYKTKNMEIDHIVKMIVLIVIISPVVIFASLSEERSKVK